MLRRLEFISAFCPFSVRFRAFPFDQFLENNFLKYRGSFVKPGIKKYSSFFARGGGGGGTPLYKLYRYVPPHRVGFLRRFGLKTGIHFAYFGLESSMVFEGTTGLYECLYRFNSKLVTKKEKYANSKWLTQRIPGRHTPNKNSEEYPRGFLIVPTL